MLTTISIFGAAFSLLAALYFATKEKGFMPIDEAYVAFRSLNVARRIVVALILVGFTYIGSTKSGLNPPAPPPPQSAELEDSYGPFYAGEPIANQGGLAQYIQENGYKIAGLPTGIKYVASKKNQPAQVMGTPTNPGVYSVRLTRKVGKVIETQETSFIILNYRQANEYLAGEYFAENFNADSENAITLYQGVSDVCALPALRLNKETTLSPKAKITVSGLPAGLKYAAKDVLNKDKTTAFTMGSVYGTPTKAGSFTAKITVTDTIGKTKLKAISSITINVKPTSSTAFGTFNGGFFNEDGKVEGMVTLTITANGKISGKILKNGDESGLTWTVSAASFDFCDEEGRYHATLTAKAGKLSPETYKIVISDERISSLNEEGEGIIAYQNLWKTDWKTHGKELAAEYKKTGLPSDDSELMLKFAASGAVTASKSYVTGTDKKGKDIIYKATCSTVLIPIFNEQGEIESGLIHLYFAPNSKKSFEGESRVVKIGEKSED